MMPSIGAITAGIAILWACSADAAENALVLGIGRESCASWQSTPARRTEGTIWIYGFWSGANWGNDRNHKVGERTDPYGDVAEVKKTCDAQPSMALFDAATKTYHDMDK
jgi:hypothetical protein